MQERKTAAVFYRGGTSKAVFFQPKDLPEDRDERDRILLHVLGSPDPYGRQLNGLGGGISSLSKAMWVERSKRNDADIDYTFAQIAVDRPVVDYSANCGNMSSAVGQFAVEEGIYPVPDGDAVIRMYNTNTGICVHSHSGLRAGVRLRTAIWKSPACLEPARRCGSNSRTRPGLLAGVYCRQAMFARRLKSRDMAPYR